MPVGIGSGCRKRFLGRLNKLAVFVLQLRPRQIVLLGISVLNVADRVLQLAYISSHAFVTLAALTRGPLYSLALTDFFLPFGRNFRQIVGPAERSTRTIGAMHHDDRCAGQFKIRVQRLDGSVVPLLDLGQEDIGQHSGRKLQLTGLNALDINNRHRAANDGRKLEKVVFSKFVGLHGVVRSTEINCFGNDLLLTTTRTDGLIIDAIACFFLVGGCPLRVDGVRERCAGTGDVGSHSGQRYGTKGNTDGNLGKYAFQHRGILKLVKTGQPCTTAMVEIQYDMFVTVTNKLFSQVHG